MSSPDPAAAKRGFPGDSAHHDAEAPGNHGGGEDVASSSDGLPDAFLEVEDTWEPSAEEDKDLAITAEQDAGAWQSCYHNTTAMVGAGVLSLPASFATLLWPGGVISLALATAISLYTILQLAWLHEQRGKGGALKRLNRYHQLTAYAFGPKTGRWMLLPFQLMVCIGGAITYTITGGASLQRIWKYTCAGRVDPATSLKHCDVSFSLSAWIVVYSAAEAVLSQVPNFTKLAWVSAVGAAASLTYSTIAWVLPLALGPATSAVDYGPKPGLSDAERVFGVFNALANIAFAFGGHNMALEIQSTIPLRPPRRGNGPPSSVPQMELGIYSAYAVTTYCYFMVAIFGYRAYGNLVEGNVLYSMNRPSGVMIFANLAVVLHVLASYQVFSFIVYDIIEKKIIIDRLKLRPTLPVRLVYRSIYAILTAFVACLLPFFGDIMGLVGALGTTPTSYTIPPIVWLKLKRPPPLSPHWWACWATIVLSASVGVLGAVGSVYQLAVDAPHFGVFQ